MIILRFFNHANLNYIPHHWFPLCTLYRERKDNDGCINLKTGLLSETITRKITCHNNWEED